MEKVYLADSKYGIGNMKRHIHSCPRRDTRDIGQSLLSTDGSILSGRFNSDEFRKLVVAIVIMHDLPFQFIE